MIQDHLPRAYLEHLRNPAGLVDSGSPDFPVSGHASTTGRVSGSLTEVWIGIDPNARLTHFGWRSRYMPRVVAGLSALAAWVRQGDGRGPGLPLEVVMDITPHDVAERLGGSRAA